MTDNDVSSNLRRMCQANYAVHECDPPMFITVYYAYDIHYWRIFCVLRLTCAFERRILIYTIREDNMPKDTKRERLRQIGALNPRPDAVRAHWFRESSFFDPLDLMQVKYEMLRHVQKDDANKAEAATLFGLSRPTYYQAEAAYERDGMAGLLPRTRGPKSAHKLTDEVMKLIEEHLSTGGALPARSLAALVQSRLGVSVHPRSIERAIARKKKA